MVTSTAPATKPAIPTSRWARGVLSRALRSASQPPASVPMRPPTTITTPASRPALAGGHVEPSLEHGRQPEGVRRQDEEEEGLGDDRRPQRRDAHELDELLEAGVGGLDERRAPLDGALGAVRAS